VFSGSGSNRTVKVTPAPDQIGTAIITIKVSDGLLETSEAFTLNVRPLSEGAPLTVTVNNATRIYGDPDPGFSGTLLGLQSGDNITATYATTATAASRVGVYPIRPLLNDPDGKLAKYQVVTNLGSLAITRASLTSRANDLSRFYQKPSPSFTGTITGIRNNDNITATYVTPANDHSPVGFYPITPVLASGGERLTNYTVTIVPGRLTISPAALTVKADDKSRPFGRPNPDLTGSITGDEGRDNITATFSTTANYLSPPGKYPIRPTLHDPDHRLSNYRVTSRDGTLTVTLVPPEPPALGVLDVRADDQVKAYSAPNPELTGTVTGLKVGDGITVTFTTVATENSPPGIYPIIAKFNDPAELLGLYLIVTHDGTLTITPPGSVRLISVSRLAPHRLFGQGDASVTYTIQASADLLNWKDLGEVLSDESGRFTFEEADQFDGKSRFFRVQLP
jgi:hypothetical protein